jgi:peptidoglycan/LPS O-acetylase OafA/YrhL
MNYQKRLEIDFLRGLFSLFIVIGHVLPYLEGDYSNHIFGTNWVVGFVILSGYLIETSVFNNLKKKSFSIKLYLFLRLSRILPLYFLIIIISTIFYLFLNFKNFIPINIFFDENLFFNKNFELKNLLGQIFFLSNFIVGFSVFGFLTATPTLIYEFWFYNLWIFRFYFSKYFLYLIIIFFIFLKLYFKIITFDFLIFLVIWLFGTYLCSFKNIQYKIYISLLGYSLLLFATSLYLFDTTYNFIKKLHLYFFHEYFIFIIPFSLIILGENKFFTGKSFYFRNLIKISNWLGRISYPVFITHTFIIFILFSIIKNYNLDKIFISTFIVFFILFIVVIISHYLSLIIEIPLMKYRERIKRKYKIETIYPEYK